MSLLHVVLQNHDWSSEYETRDDNNQQDLPIYIDRANLLL